MAVYGFARLADDIGDEAHGDRLAMLAWLQQAIERAAQGEADHPVLVAVGRTICARHLSLQPFIDLIEANRQDQVVHRYQTFEELLGYCRLSANPVGRLVLELFGVSTPERRALSDDVCTGLQLVEHLQDVAEDLGNDRLYLPIEDLDDGGVSEERLAAEVAAGTASDELRSVIALVATRAAGLLAAGPELVGGLRGRPALAVGGFAAGGRAALDAVVAADFDVIAQRCRPSPWRLLARGAQLLWVAQCMRRAGRGVAPTRSGAWV